MTAPEHAVHYLDIVTPDAEAVRDLYEESYGWRFQPMEPALGNAFVAELPGGALCGFRAPMHAEEKPTVRTYVRVADIKASVQRATQSGATLFNNVDSWVPDCESLGAAHSCVDSTRHTCLGEHRAVSSRGF
jgi:predicted enzyme related to lactoylglutathione lyase